MARLLSVKNLANPTANGQVLKGNTDGTQEWAASSGISSITSYLVIANSADDSNVNLVLNNFSLQITDRDASTVDISSLVVSGRDQDVPIKTIITAAS